MLFQLITHKQLSPTDFSIQMITILAIDSKSFYNA